MGKRSDFPRKDRDGYFTPPEAVWPITPFLRTTPRFAEPFCGDGAIIRTLEALGYECNFASDIEPQGPMAETAEWIDAMHLTIAEVVNCDVIVTNPPWPSPRGRGEPTLSFIQAMSVLKPTWMLLAADFAHNVYSSELLRAHCSDIVSVGRVKWEAGSPHTGKENAAWYLFNRGQGPAIFHPRQTPVRQIAAEGSVEDLI